MLTINDMAQVTIASCVLINAVQSLLIFFHNRKIIQKISVVETKVVEKIDTVKTEVVAVAKATNGLQAKLLQATGELKFAEGVKSAENAAAIIRTSA